MSDSGVGGIERVDEILERNRLDREDITGVFARFISKYSDPMGKKDIFDERIKITLSDGCKKNMNFMRYLELIRIEEIDLVSNGNPRRIYVMNDITTLIKDKLPEKILKRLEDYSEGHLIRRCDRGHILLGRKGHNFGYWNGN